MEWLVLMTKVLGVGTAAWFFWDKFVSIKKNIRPLSFIFSAYPLDGTRRVIIKGTKIDSFEGGIKFHITIDNIGTKQVLLRHMSCELIKTAHTPPNPTVLKDVSTMRFGNAVVPHRLFIVAGESTEKAWWLIQSSSNEKAKQLNCKGINNLLELDDGSMWTFPMPPQNTEQIDGAFSAQNLGVFTARFLFQYQKTNGKVVTCQTQPITIHTTKDSTGNENV